VSASRPSALRASGSLPSVGVVVPCYGYAHWLEGCVDSVLAQPGVDAHVLIVDDCSPDDTPSVSRALIERDRRVEYLRHEQNQGLIGTINDGLPWAEGFDYTVVLSADDQLVPGSLQRATSVMERQPEVGLVYGWATYAPTDQPLPRGDGDWQATKVWRGQEWIRMRCRTGYNCISSPEVVVRSEVHRRAGEYDPACHHTSDLNMWLRIAAIADIAHIRGVPQAIYRVHADSMLRSDPSEVLSLRERRAAFVSFFEHAGSLLDDAGGLAQLAWRALARQALWRASRTVDRGLHRPEDRQLVEELVAFAQETCPAYARLPEWHGFQWRRRIGAGRSQWFPLFLATGAAHRWRGNLAQQRLRTKGI
jgi:GT2 family glycosyltransferase